MPAKRPHIIARPMEDTFAPRQTIGKFATDCKIGAQRFLVHRAMHWRTLSAANIGALMPLNAEN